MMMLPQTTYIYVALSRIRQKTHSGWLMRLPGYPDLIWCEETLL